MILKDYHIHTTYCDGKNTAEEVILSAINLGLKEIGFSGHSFTSFEKSYCMSRENTHKYIDEIFALKNKYKDKIKIYCGIEQDYYSSEPTDCYDYVIGSVHYLKINDEYIPVDESAEILVDAVNRYYNGDFYLLAEDYFKTVADVAEKLKPDVVGHFDLITKFNEKHRFFDTNNERYVTSWKNAVDRLITKNISFEINTGAISRGYTTKPYPSKEIIDYIIEKGGKFIMSSDSHSAETLCYKFDEFEHLAAGNITDINKLKRDVK